MDDTEYLNVGDGRRAPLPRKLEGCEDIETPFAIGEYANGITYSAFASTDENKYVCNDRHGNRITPPQWKSSPYTLRHALILWDLRQGHIRLGEDNTTLYMRVVPYGSFDVVNEWVSVGSIEDGYHIPARNRIPGFDRYVILQCKKLPRVKKGIRFGNAVYKRISVKGLEDGKVAYTALPDEKIKPDNYNDLEDDAYVITFPDSEYASVTSEQKKKIVHEAWHLAKTITLDEHSASNLIRMFANPALEPFKQFSYILYGGGGNGKGVLIGALEKAFPEYLAKIRASQLSEGSFNAQQEAHKLIGKLWATDDEADQIDSKQMTSLKRISTGDPIDARLVQQNLVTFNPKSTVIIATNEPVITTLTAASSRRFVFVRMRDGQTREALRPLRMFLREWGIYPFMLASCQLWEESDEAYRDIAIGDVSDLDDEEAWFVNEIMNKGVADPMTDSAHPHRMPRNSANKLGIRRTCQLIGNERRNVYVIADNKRFNVYAEQMLSRTNSSEDAQKIAAGFKKRAETLQDQAEHPWDYPLKRDSMTQKTSSATTNSEQEQASITPKDGSDTLVNTITGDPNVAKSSDTYDDDTEFDVSPIPGIHKKGGESDKVLKRIEASHNTNTVEIPPISPADEETLPEDTNLPQSLTTYESAPSQPPDQLTNIPFDNTPPFDETSIPPENIL